MPRRCEICGGTAFVPAEYRAFGQLDGTYGVECADCGGLVLDADAISDRGSRPVGAAIRRALVAARESISWVDEAPTTPTLAWAF